jgi:hypoxanthine phosphoribosyltransferase
MDTLINDGFVLEDDNGKLARIEPDGSNKLPYAVMLSALTVYYLRDDRFIKSREGHHWVSSGMTLATWLFGKGTTLAKLPVGVCSWSKHGTEPKIQDMQNATVTEAKTQFFCGPWPMSPFCPDLQGDLDHQGDTTRLLLHWKGFDKTIQKLVAWVNEFHPEIEYVYGPPRGGLVLAVALSHHLNIKMLSAPPWIPNMRLKTLWVDDIYGTGETFNAAKGNLERTADVNHYGAYAVWVTRDPAIDAWYGCVMRNEDWVVFPWEADDPQLASADETDYLQRRSISHPGEQK